MIAPRRLSFLTRLLALTLVSVAASACYFDGHFGHRGHFRSCAPIRVCR